MGTPTLTIGIPAHDEEKNIANLLRSILAQKRGSYRLRTIIVVCDGCTDNTAKIVNKFRQEYSFIKLFDVRKHLGKASALNRIYSVSNSDFLLTLDADVVLERDCEIEIMFRSMEKNPHINVVGGRFVPVEPKTLMGKFSYVSFLSFEDAILKLNGGNNMFALIGAASLIRRKLYESFRYPKGTISDQNYLYVMATQGNKHGFKLAKESRFLIRTVETFKDWRILGARSVVADRENVSGYFGKEILSEYYMPRQLFIPSLLSWLRKKPLDTFGSVAMNVFIRTFPYTQAISGNGRWETTLSSKGGITFAASTSHFHLRRPFVSVNFAFLDKIHQKKTFLASSFSELRSRLFPGIDLLNAFRHRATP